MSGATVAQPGATGPAQPGATAPGAQAQPGATMVIAPANSPQVQSDQAAPATDYNVPQRAVPAPRYAAPVDVGHLHAPVAVPNVAPIKPLPGTIRVGGFQMPAPDFIPANVRDGINGAAAGAESQVTTFARSVGVSAGRSDRIAGGAALGALAGGAALGLPSAVPGAVVGAIGGGVVGGVIAAVIATPYIWLVPVSVPQIIAGVAIGAVLGGAAGALVTGVPAAVVGAVPGAVLGGAASLFVP